MLPARIALFCAFALASPLASAATCYVNSAATGTNAGTSWANAYTSLQSALVNYPGCMEIWVARGTYKPTATTDRTIAFNINPGVIVYGGFAGTEATLAVRQLAVNPTILSGDIGVAGDSRCTGTFCSSPIMRPSSAAQWNSSRKARRRPRPPPSSIAPRSSAIPPPI
jgi:hypothetical protein